MMIQDVLRKVKADLVTVADNPQLEAELLLAHVLDKPRSYLHAWPEAVLTTDAMVQFESAIARRKNHEPIAYITGKRSFWSLELMVTRDTLIPRPETELLVETILTLFADKPLKVADLGTGSGAIALALAHERRKWEIYAVDNSEKALAIARKNAQQLGIQQISFCHGNWCTALPVTNFDVIVSNPPYIAEMEWEQYAQGLAFEPPSALLSGRDGLDDILEIAVAAKSYLKPGGYLLFEHGYAQAEAVSAILDKECYMEVRSLADLSGQKRVTLGRLSV